MKAKDSPFAEIDSHRLVFGDVVIDCDDFTVIRDQQKQPLAPRAFDVLLYLIQHRERIVVKPELFAEIWKERFVSDNALTRTIADIRQALGDRAHAPRYIETIPKRGYRFIAELQNDSTTKPIAKQAVEADEPDPVNPTENRLPHNFDVSQPLPPLSATPIHHGITRRKLARALLIICVVMLSALSASFLFRKDKARGQGGRDQAGALYLKGRDRLETFDPREIEKAKEYFQRAINLDPNYAPAYVGMADYYTVAKHRTLPGDYMLLAKAAAARALVLDDNLAEAHAAMGRISELYDWDSARADQEIKRAVELDPQSNLVRLALANHLAVQGHPVEALNESQLALQSDPHNVRLNLTAGWILYSTRRFDEAATWFKKMAEAGVYVPGSYGWLAQIYEAQGRYQMAVEMDLKYRAISGTRPAEIVALSNAYAISGWKGYWQEALQQRQQIGRESYVEPYMFAAIYARLGEKEQALNWLDKSVSDRSLFLTRLNGDPKFDNLRAEPRFQDVIRRIGFRL